MPTLSVLAPAKINLFLNIRPRRPDGFHEICSVMQAVRLWDRLDVTPLETVSTQDGSVANIHFTCNSPDLERKPESNLVVRAYHLFWQETGLPPLGLQVHLEKNIPVQAGMGGGSSDAAAMLVVLNHLSHAGLSDVQLRTMGAHLGSDVPFFIAGGIALVGGRGEMVEPLPPHLVADPDLVVIKPLHLPMDTRLAYIRYATRAQYEVKFPDHLLAALAQPRNRDESHLESYLLNDFEKVLFAEYPLLAEIAHKMSQAGIRRPLLSGSGSAMVGFSEPSPATRQNIERLFPKSQYEVHWTQFWHGGLVQKP